MILIELLTMLSIGVVSFLIASGLEMGKQNAARTLPNHLHGRNRASVESDLDGLLLRYNQGLLSEKQYGEQSDALIDQLADLLHEVET